MSTSKKQISKPIGTTEVSLISDWVEMLREYELEKQCAKIADWLKQCCGEISGIAFFLKDSRLGQQLLYRDNFPGDALQNLQGLLPHLHQAVDTEYEAIFFAMREGNLAIIDGHESDKSPEEVILTTILSNQEHPIGVVALIVKAHSVSCWMKSIGHAGSAPSYLVCWKMPSPMKKKTER